VKKTKKRKKIEYDIQLSNLIDSFLDSVLVVDRNRKILFANKASSYLFGYSPKYFRDKDVKTVLPDLSGTVFQELRQRKKLEITADGKKGKKLFLELSLSRLNSGRKNIFLLSARDISKRKKIEEENERIRSEAVSNSRKLHALFGSVDVMLWSVKEDEKGELYYEQVNDAFAAVVGLKPEDYNGKYLRDLGTEEEFKGVRRSLAIAKENKIYTYERNVERNGKSRTFIIRIIYAGKGKGAEYYIGSAIDITERKESEEQVLLLAQAFESTTEMITITDLTNRITFVNKAFLKNYGYELNEILGKDASILASTESQPGLTDEIFLTTLAGNWRGELINIRRDGSEFPVYLSTSQIKTPLDEVKGLIGVARDITDLKQAEERLKQSLREKEILLKEVYHRVKNNMQVINSLLHIQSQTITDPRVVEMFRESQNRIRIMTLIHEKLYRSEDLSKIDFSLYIRDLTDQLKRAYPTISPKVDVIINSEKIYLGIDKAIPCGLVINELVSNAYKYAFTDSGKCEIRIDLTSPEENKYNLVVRDNGVGFPAEIDFRNTDSLGMVLVTTLVDQLDGNIELDRTRGTRFTINF
jgi:hypothetical protein